MTPITAFHGWAAPKLSGYVVTRGLWVEDSATPDEKFVSLWQSNMGAPFNDAAEVNIRVIITGRRQSPQDVVTVESDALALASAAVEDYSAECIANIRAMGLPNGPFFTEENRVYYEVNFEIMMRY